MNPNRGLHNIRLHASCSMAYPGWLRMHLSHNPNAGRKSLHMLPSSLVTTCIPNSTHAVIVHTVNQRPRKYIVHSAPCDLPSLLTMTRSSTLSLHLHSTAENIRESMNVCKLSPCSTTCLLLAPCPQNVIKTAAQTVEVYLWGFSFALSSLVLCSISASFR